MNKTGQLSLSRKFRVKGIYWPGKRSGRLTPNMLIHWVFFLISYLSPFLKCHTCSIALSYPTLMIPWAVAHQAPLSMGFPRQEYWSRLPSPFPGDLPNPGIKPMSLVLAGRFFTTEPPGKPSQNNTEVGATG